MIQDQHRGLDEKIQLFLFEHFIQVFGKCGEIEIIKELYSKQLSVFNIYFHHRTIVLQYYSTTVL